MCVEARLSVQQRQRGSRLRSVSAAAILASRLSSNFWLAVILVLVVMEMTFQMICSHSVCAPE